jgi:hypothetical protein
MKGQGKVKEHTFEHKYECVEGASHVSIWSKIFPDRQSRKYKSLM